MQRSIDRRSLLRWSLLAGLGSALGGWSCASAKRPNVLFIAIDDLNDWAGCLGGHRDARTPNLDRLAEGGVLFTQAHCPAPLCSASRTAVLTGLEPFTTGVYTNRHDFRPAYPDLETLPQAFRSAGYHTMGTGKVFHFSYPEAFDEFVQPHQGSLLRFRSDRSWGFGKALDGRGLVNWGPLEIDLSNMFDGQVVEAATQFLTADHDRPFFLAAGLFRPHMPWLVPKEYFEPFPPEEIALPEVFARDLRDVPKVASWTVGSISRQVARRVEGGDQWRKSVAAYLASMAFMDDMLGRILAALAESPYADDTIVVLWSDHGHLVGEKGHWGKHVLWDDATHVPLIFNAPWIRGGSRCATPVTLIHLFPTLLELCGIPATRPLDGRSLVPLIEDPAAAWSPPAIMTYLGGHSVRTERWRYTRYQPGGEELYDHQYDPHEWYNQADAGPLYTEVKERLAQLLPTGVAAPLDEGGELLPDDE